MLLVAWLVAVPLGSSSLPWLASAVRNSALLDGVDQVMPQQAQALSDALRDTVDTRGFPDVFGGLAPTRAREVAAPDPALAGSQVVVNAKRVGGQGARHRAELRPPHRGLRLRVRPRAGDDQRARGGRHPTVSVEVNGERHERPGGRLRPATATWPSSTCPGCDAPVMPFATRPRPTPAPTRSCSASRWTGPYNAQSARVRDVGNITGPDIYDSGEVTREIYTIRALVRSGNSGGPLVDPGRRRARRDLRGGGRRPEHRVRA